MQQIKPFSGPALESLSRLMGDLGDWSTGSQISLSFSRVKLSEVLPSNATKWRRLYAAFSRSQERTGYPHEILHFIKDFVSKDRFTYHGGAEDFNAARQGINRILAMNGLEYRADGEFHRIEQPSTLTEAERRFNALQGKLSSRSIHPEVMKYCRVELLDQNYYHAAFEACKGLCQRIRDVSGSQLDGVELIQSVFRNRENRPYPLILFNAFMSETEKNYHNGLADMMQGVMRVFRNPAAHTPKVMWEDDENTAADWLTLISRLHFILDMSFTYPPKGQNG